MDYKQGFKKELTFEQEYTMWYNEIRRNKYV